MKIHFLTFASSSFEKSLMRIKTEAENTRFFDTISCLKETDLPLIYRIKNISRLNRFTKGYGYWMWKSFITKSLLEKIDDGDILLYTDSGCTLNMEGDKRFAEYIRMLTCSEFSNLSFQMYHLEKQYSKGDLFKYLGLEKNSYIKNSEQLVGGIFFIKKDERSIKLVNEWYSICHSRKDLIDDSASKFQNDPEFVEHRHDQSVFSLLRKIHGSLILKDETFFYNWNDNKQFPIHAKRLR